MKLVKTITVTTLALWLMQLVLFWVFLMTRFTNCILQVLVCFGSNIPETAVQRLLSQILSLLTCPIRQCLPRDWINDSMLGIALLFGADSLLWGGGIGALLYVIWSAYRRLTASKLHRTVSP
jgi:hypothetical protein